MFVSLAIFSSRHCLAQADPILVSEAMVNANGVDSNTSPSIAPLSPGRFIVTWHDGDPTTGWGRVYSNNGLTSGNEFSLNTDTGGRRYGHVTAALRDGGFVVFWRDASASVQGQRFDSNFRPVGGRFVAAACDCWPAAASSIGDPILNVDDARVSTSLVVPFQSTLQAGAPFAANVGPISVAESPALAAAPDGNYATAWSDANGNLIVRTFGKNGNALTGEVEANSSSGGVRSYPSVAYGPNSDLWVAWEGNQSGRYDIYLRHFSPDGTPRGAEMIVDQTTEGDHHLPQLAVGDHGTVAVSWTSEDGNGNKEVFARILHSDGTSASTEFRVNQFTSGNQYTNWAGGRRGVFVVNGNYIFAWVGKGAQGEGVYMTIFRLTGALGRVTPGRSRTGVGDSGADTIMPQDTCPASPQLNATYYTVAETDQDMNRSVGTSASSNYVMPALGPDGLPVFNPNATATPGTGDGTVFVPEDLLSNGEITWWSATLNNGGAGGASDVVKTSTATVSLPFSNSSFYPPNGTGPNDFNGFQAAVLSGFLSIPAAETVTFSISSDDAAYAYLDGQVVCDEGGAHAATAVSCTTSTISAGDHLLQVFSIDLDTAQSVLDFSVTTSDACVGSGPMTPTITWPTPSSITYGTPLSATQLDATASVAGTFTYTPAAGTVLGAGVHTLTANFTPTDSADYTTATATVSLTVNDAVLTVTANNQTMPLGGPLPSFTDTISGFVNGDNSSVVSGTATMTTTATAASPAGTYPITFSVEKLTAANYTFKYVSGTLTVTKGAATITWPTPAAIVYGTALSATQLDATFSVPGSCVYTPAAGTVPAAGSHTLSVTCTPTDSADYSAATATVTLTVTAALLTVTANHQAMTYGGPLPHLTDTISGFVNGDNSSVVSGTATLTTTATTASPVGTYPITFSAEKLTAANYTFKYVDGTLTVTKATPAITWPAPAPIPYGTALTAAQLDCSSPVPGVFTYNPLAGTVLSVGTHTLKCTLAPTDSVDYTTASATVSISVGDFSISATPSSRSVYTGEAASYTLTLLGQTGFNLPVTFSCQGLPANTTCTFDPATVTGGRGTVRVVVQTTAPTPPSVAKASPVSPLKRYGPVAFAGFLLLVLPKRLRRNGRIWIGCLMLASLLALGFCASGCSGPRLLVGGTPVGAQTITFAGTMTNGSQTLTHTAKVRLNVKSLF